MGAIIDGKAVTAVFTQPRFDGSFPSGLAEYLNALAHRRPVLLFAFAPKAAGTFLRSAAIEAVDGQLVRITHAQGGRDAQPYLPVFVNYYLGGVCDGVLVAHVHMQALPANRHFLEILGIRPIIMLRSISDMLASYWDMLTESPEARAEGLNCIIPDGFPDLSDAQKADFMIDMIAPWYVSYFATWLDYLRQRNRATQSERALHQRAMDFHLGPDPVRVRRMLERPFGSVRWKEDTPDRAASEVLPVASAAAGSST